MDNETELRRLVTASIGEAPKAEAMAEAVFQSRFHFHRSFCKTLGEPPARLVRRLNLERAAFSLRATDKDIIVVALEAGYQSHEGFTRAFRRAFQMSPREYRNAARRIQDLPGTSGLHFDPTITLKETGNRNMDLIDLMLNSDYTAKRSLLECGKLLTDRQLDAPLAFRHTLTPFVEPARTLRESLQRIVESGWLDGMWRALNYTPEDPAYRTLSGESPEQLQARLHSFHTSFRTFVQYVRKENLWSKEWVDESCDEPHTFSVGGVIEATLTWDIAYRMMLARQFEAMGFSSNII
ncbi:MAG: AraC family transcriptional regulator [Armatimonas sp.]